MERFLIGLLGAVAVILALIGASYYRTPRAATGEEPAASGKPAAATGEEPAARGKPVAATGATIAMAAFAFLLFLVTLAYAGVSALQWRAIEAQTRELQREHRAWVYAAPALNGAMIIKGREVSLPARYKLENTGGEPAVDIEIAAAIVPEAAADILAFQKSLCARLGSRPGAPGARNAVFPKQSLDIMRLESAAPEIVNAQVTKQSRTDLPFWWVGCIDYQTYGRGEHHRTTFVYEIAELGAGPQGIVRISLSDRIIAKDKLVIVPYLRGGFSAD
jgi:hypothetical protein